MHTGKYFMVNINAPVLEPTVRDVSHGLVVWMIDKPSPSLVLHSLTVVNGFLSDEIIKEALCIALQNLNDNKHAALGTNIIDYPDIPCLHNK